MKKTLLLMMMLVSLVGLSASMARTITGTVYNNADKKPIPGVSVKVKGLVKGSTTSAGGHYAIDVTDDKAILVFTFLGYQAKDQPVGKATVIDVYLQASNSSLNEIVVSGYGTAKRKTPLNGKTYYGGTTQNATHNLPADVIESIQVMDDYGDQANIAGIKSGDPQKVLNVVVRGNATPVANNSMDKLLKTMPGVSVGADGTVTAQGRTLNEVTLNGLAYKATPGASPAIRVRGGTNFNGYVQQYNAPTDESYSQIVENSFTDPKSTPLSTFAVDVDAASYSNFRRFINNGQLPPKNAVRIEELVNYFHYNLPEPTNGDPVAIHTELSSAPWNPQHRLLRIGLKAKSVKTGNLPPSNLVFLLDVSGSMNEPNKLPLVKASMKLLVDQLRPIDHVAIVVYAGEAGLKLPSTPGDEKTRIKDAIDGLNANGGTAGGAGIMMAYQIAKEKFIKGGNNRIILATDGDFNVGASSDKDMEQLIEDERQSNVNISILGFGMGNVKDSKMETMADKGHGNYAYIDNITEATKAMVSEFGGTLFTVAKDVKMQIEFNPAKVQAYRLIGYEDRLLNKEDFNNDKKVAGDMGVGHTVTALYEIIPTGIKDSFTTSVDPLKYQKVDNNVALNSSSDMVTVKFRYKQPDGDKSQMEQVVVKDEPAALSKTTDDFRFAASVAELGLLLRDSEFKQQSSFKGLIEMAKNAKGKDDEGYRAEFIRLAESAKLMSKSTELASDVKEE